MPDLTFRYLFVAGAIFTHKNFSNSSYQIINSCKYLVTYTYKQIFQIIDP